LRIGCVKYLNARPLIHGWPGPVVLDHPAALSKSLADGDLDIALVSSFEFLRNPVYQIVDDVSISAEGPVYSVVVAHDVGATFSEIDLDPASLTSVALLQCLLSLRGQPLQGTNFTGDALLPLKPGGARLLIGDQALRFRLKFGDVYRYFDLGEEWKKATDLPFVFALWLVRPKTDLAGRVAAELRTIRDTNLANLDQITGCQQEFDREFCRRYYTLNLRFRFGQREKEGLREFGNACANLGLIRESKLDLQLL